MLSLFRFCLGNHIVGVTWYSFPVIVKRQNFTADFLMLCSSVFPPSLPLCSLSYRCSNCVLLGYGHPTINWLVFFLISCVLGEIKETPKTIKIVDVASQRLKVRLLLKIVYTPEKGLEDVSWTWPESSSLRTSFRSTRRCYTSCQGREAVISATQLWCLWATTEISMTRYPSVIVAHIP